MIAGDLETMSLADILQWCDNSRARGCLTVERAGIETWLRVDDRGVREISRRPESGGALHQLGSPAEAEPWLKLPEGAAAVERAFDLFLEHGGRFRFADGTPPSPGVAVELDIREMVYEGMRHLDEWGQVSEAYPDEGARLAATGVDAETTLLPVARVLLRAAARGLTLGEVRLALSLSRPAMLRRVHELVRLGLVSVEGAEGGADPVAKLIAQATDLLREGQFDESAHVLRAVLESDPSDQRVATLLADVERRQRIALEQEIDRASIVCLTDPGAREAERLTEVDREIVDRVDGRRDVAAICVASPHREVETLKSLRKLVRLGLAVLAPPDGLAPP